MKVYANAKGTEIAFIVCIYPEEKGKKEAITVEPLYYGTSSSVLITGGVLISGVK